MSNFRLHAPSVAGVVLLLIGSLFNTVGCMIPRWLVRSDAFVDISIGLFQTCKNDVCMSNSDSFVNTTDSLHYFQGFYLGGILCSWLSCAITIFAVVALGLGKEVIPCQDCINYMLWINSFTSCVVVLTIFCQDYIINVEQYAIGYALWFCIVGMVVVFSGGIVFHVGRCECLIGRRPDQRHLITSPLEILSSGLGDGTTPEQDYTAGVSLPPYPGGESPPDYQESQC